MLFTLLTLLHVAVCLILILAVLLQTGKGADIAAAFGGSSQTAFGARGATTFMAKVTTGAAVLFMLTSMILALVSSSPSLSVLEEEPVPGAASAPSQPAQEGGTLTAPADEGVQGSPAPDTGGDKMPSDPNDDPATDDGSPSP